MHKSLLFSTIILTAAFISAQVPQVTGTVTDESTGEAINNAIVSDSAGTRYTSTNKNGFYSLGMNAGKYVLFVTADGYERKRFEMEVYGQRNLDIALNAMDYWDLDTNSNQANAIKDYKSGYASPLEQQVKQMPAALCVPDPVKFLQYLPGVNGGLEGLSGLYARGGNADQNLVMMDGLPLYGNGHIFGFLSCFNAEQVRDVQFYKGVAPARYGGRSGAILDINNIEGNKSRFNGNLGFDMLLMHLNMNGPMNKSGTVTGSFGLRRSWLDLLLPKTNGNYITYNLHDLNGKISAQIDDRNKLNVWVYNGRDKFGTKIAYTDHDSLNRVISISLEQGLVWQNTLTGANWSHKINNRHYSNLLVGMSRYSYKNSLAFEGSVTTDTGSNNGKISISQNNAITDFIIREDLEVAMLNSNYLRYGGEIIRHGFKPGIEHWVYSGSGNPFDSTFGLINKQGAIESSLYGEYEFNLNRGLKMNTGARLWFFGGKDKVYLRPEPRIMLSQQLEGNKALRFAAGVSHQGLNQLTGVNASLPSSVWFPAGKNFKPQQSIMVSGGYYKPIKGGIEFTLDAYYRKLRNITDVTGVDVAELSPNYWEKMMAQGSGNAYGLEAMLMKKHGRFNGLAGYTLSLADRKFDEINFGKQFPFRWDRRHKFTITGVYNVSDEFYFNFALVIMSGNMVTVPTGKYVAADGTFIYDYSDKNNFRMPLYRRLDMGFVKEIRPDSRVHSRQFWGINVYNTLNWFNPMTINIQVDPKDNVKKAFGLSYFPFFPSVFYKLTFTE